MQLGPPADKLQAKFLVQIPGYVCGSAPPPKKKEKKNQKKKGPYAGLI
jgi:hypothetical protein